MKRFPLGVWLFAMALAGLTSLPYAVGYVSTPPGWSYWGAPALPAGTAVDYSSYLNGMWLGYRGEWQYRLLATHEPHPGVPLVKGFYLLLGQLAGVASLGLPLVYHVARFLCTALFVLALWRFACHFFDAPAERWTCLVFGTLFGGWSWLILLLPGEWRPQDISPIEFWLIDAFNLLGVFYAAHFAAALALQIVMVLALESWIRGHLRSLVLLTLVLAVVSFLQPYLILLSGGVGAVVTGYHLLVSRRLTPRRAALLAVPLGIHAALTLFQYLALQSDPVTNRFVQANITLSPPVIFYLLGYLPFGVPILAGLRSLSQQVRSDDRWVTVLAWAGIVILLLYAPVRTQRRYLLGFQIPLAVLATYGWRRAILPRFAPRRRPLVTIAYTALGSVGLLLMFLGNAAALAQPRRYPDAFYEADERRAYGWLRRESGVEDVIFTTTNTSGGRVIAATGRRVFIGSWFETVDYSHKVEQAKRFYDPVTPDAWRRVFLRSIGAAYVWYDRDAREMGDWNPERAGFLEPAFEAGTVTLYRVRL